MCAITGTPPALACTIGDLSRGAIYHDQYGETWMVLDLPRSHPINDSGAILRLDEWDVMVVNIGNSRGGNHNDFGFNGDEYTGVVTPVYASTKLGYDHKGRLYTSTALNGWHPPADPIADDCRDRVAGG